MFMFSIVILNTMYLIHTQKYIIPILKFNIRNIFFDFLNNIQIYYEKYNFIEY